MFLVKIETESCPDLKVEIGIRGQYKEFDYIEDAFAWIFLNQKMIKSYKIFEAKEFTTKNSCYQDKNYSIKVGSSGGFCNVSS